MLLRWVLPFTGVVNPWDLDLQTRVGNDLWFLWFIGSIFLGSVFPFIPHPQIHRFFNMASQFRVPFIRRSPDGTVCGSGLIGVMLRQTSGWMLETSSDLVCLPVGTQSLPMVFGDHPLFD